MPGIVGFTDKKNKYNKKMLRNMQKSLKHFNNYIDEKLYKEENFYCTQTNHSFFNNRLTFKNQIYVWLDGEFYNQNHLKNKYNTKYISDAQLFLDIFIINNSFEFLSEIDGVFSIVIYNKNKNEIHLISDRFGFKPLYWAIINENLVFSSEIKGFFNHLSFDKTIDKTSIDDFFTDGFLSQDKTWFENIKLLNPAYLLTFNTKKSTLDKFKYWGWDKIETFNFSIDKKELANEFKRLFLQSIDKKIKDNKRIGITLSGGLDSRLILAAINNKQIDLNTFTFGQSKSYDIAIAKIVSKIKGVSNHSFEINNENWLYPRVKNIWYSDGQYNILDMHGLEFCNEYKKYMDINLNGFLGDAILGGSYISNNQTTENKFINRGRRLINQALILAETQIIQRRPFFDNELFDFILSIPENYRKKSSIYNEFLLELYPEFYVDIPCTKKQGYPLNYSRLKIKILKNKNKILNLINRGEMYKRHYTNYPKWIRQNPAVSFFKKIINNKNAIYPNFISKDKAQYYLIEHLNHKKNFHNELCLILTFEIWMQQIYNNKLILDLDI